jgi:hypothetical protein
MYRAEHSEEVLVVWPKIEIDRDRITNSQLADVSNLTNEVMVAFFSK